ncbi:hypothetical protein FJ959_22335 [Mesorhizobium sp. B2-2-4]|uniref:hypothetical protein n=1 Tax=unclassified Mesorhizobium TaxID=325217 RepID=UPI0011267924|nr:MULTISPECIES: hypothetical protein [unclassified Mesorhizobium]TPM53270.1 hypothetical protein FJ959_22335 [Mesorhizobium sp. B2-2-4]TPM62087.1 hypothetical protein FJ965_21035 [Mesorhizobium sp. B2-2-1]TPN68458.1 hypothetical protein FJ984_11515 [Mesorhizobium sp. B1-1-3]
MPYKPTGRPNGRPRKNPQPAAAPEQQEAPPRVNLARARARYRMLAELANPSPFVVPLDRRGRPRHKPRHSSVKV